MNSISDLKNLAVEKITTHNALNKNYCLKPDIDDGKCVKCEKCAKICEESEHHALSSIDKKIKLDADKCKGCSLCSIVCPQNAISMR